MANKCYFTMRVVSPSREHIERLFNIINEKDGVYHLPHKVFESTYYQDISQEEDGLYSAIIDGAVAWYCDRWVDGFTDEETNYNTLNDVCKDLVMSVEFCASEPLMEFQEHGYINIFGETCSFDCVRWDIPAKWKMSMNRDIEELDFRNGQYGKDYGTWMNNGCIYKKKAVKHW